MRTINNMERINKGNAQVLERLSSGLSINKAADDAAGLAISEKMRAQIRGLSRADRNIQDAGSLLQTVESGLGTVTELIQRMRELTIRSMNDTLTETDRNALNEELTQLKFAVDSTSQQNEWSGNPVIEAHSPTFNKIKGNHFFSSDRVVHIVDGFNDDLEIVIDGVSRKVTLPAGEYKSVDALVDTLDDLLLSVDKNLIAHVTENRTVSIQAENSQSIDYIKGGASFLFYDYTPGIPPGMIIGATEYRENGFIEAKRNQSDKLTFFVGSDRLYEIDFPEGKYSRDEAINHINEELEKKGETDVKAIPYEDDKIALTSSKYVITGVGGNMIEIDNITSVLYDNRKSGSISKSQAYVLGHKDISNGLDFTSENSELIVYIEGKQVKINFLDESESEKLLTGTEITRIINEIFEEHDINARGSIVSGRLEIRSDYYGSGSQVTVDMASTAFDHLFVRHQVGYASISPNQGRNASFKGYYGIEEITFITEENNKLTGSVGEVQFSIELETKEYTKDELITALNEQVNDIPIEFTLSSSTSGERSAIVVSNVTTNEIFSFDTDSSMFSTLMKGVRIDEPTLKSGETIEHREAEGIAAPPEYEYKPAVATGRSSLAGLEITSENNKMTFTLNGEQKEVLLINGNYDSAEAFLDKHREAFYNAGVIASSNGLNQLMLTTREAGDGQTLGSFGGSAHEYMMARRVESIPANGTGTPPTLSTVNGVYEVPKNYKIDDTNNQLSFTYTQDDKDYDIAIELDKTTYVTPSILAAYIENHISQALEKYELPVDALSVNIDDLGRLSLRAENAGQAHTFSNLDGNLFKELFQKRETTSIPLAYRTGSAIQSDAYIIGRDSIKDKEFIIHPEVNDLLYFDFKHNGSTTIIDLKLKPGSYTDQTLIEEINEKLESELEQHGFFTDLIKAQIGGVESETASDDEDKLVFKINMQDDGRDDTGTYVIDSVRGTAAFTFFYPSLGEPEPTYTIGITDLSNGVVINEGENDTFIFDVDNMEKKIVLPPGKYNVEALLNQLNTEFEKENANVIASLFEGRLKLSSIDVGQIPIDGIRGNARGTLFYETDSRSADDEWTFQIGANSGNNVTVDKVRTSAKLLRINTIMIDDSARAEKALERLDEALGIVNSERSRIGSYTNRLNHTLNNVRQTAENMVQNESQIRDADMAKEIMDMAKAGILLQANQHALAHVYNNPQNILELLKG
nr:flagellin [Oceanobacillus alkalisoli]